MILSNLDEVAWTRIGISFIVFIVSVVIIIYQILHHNKLLKYRKENSKGSRHTANTADEFLRKYQSLNKKNSDKCSQDCLTGLWLVAETNDILTKYKHDLNKGLDVILKNRERLRNPTTREYPFAIHRTQLYGETYYTLKAHGSQRLINIPLNDVQKILDKELCPSETCNLRSICDNAFKFTDLNEKKFTTIRYAWFDPISGNEIFKESILCRFNEDIVIGTGYIVAVLEEVPHIPLVVASVVFYGLLLLFMFVFPGIFLLQSYASFSHNKVLHYVFLILFLIGSIYVIFRHTNTLSIESSLSETIIYNQTQTKRIIAGTLAAMALSFTFIHRTYKLPIIKQALFMSIVLSILAFIDVVSDTDRKKEDEERSLMYNYHATSTLVTCSILVLVWLFTFLVLQTK